MKKIQITVLSIILLFAVYNKSNAQGWCQDRSGIYSVGIGGTQAIAFTPYYPAIYGGGMSLNVSGEYKIQRFVGLGFQTGVDFLFGPPYRDIDRRYTAIGIPIALKVNVHILEAANVNIKDRLDVYAGLNVGGGPAFYTAAPGSAGVFGFIQAGPQIGIRYWLNHSIGIFGEFGWGATFANVGFSF